MVTRRKRKKERELRREKREQEVAQASKRNRNFTALSLAALSTVLVWLSMPGPGRCFWWLAWVSLVPMIWLIQSPTLPHKLFRQVWIASLLFWLVTLHFVRLPFWALWFGWFALSTYLSIYLPLFVAISRTLVHRFRVPTVIAAPVVYTGLEWVRVNFLTGFGLACLSHSQYKHEASLQIAEVFGAYGVSFAIVFVCAATAIASSFSWNKLTTNVSIPTRLCHAFLAIAMFVAVAAFGSNRLATDATLRKSAEPHKNLKVALIQSSIDTLLVSKSDEELKKEFENRSQLTHGARAIAKDDLDLIVWPESSFAYPDYLSGVDEEITLKRLDNSRLDGWQQAIGVPYPFRTTTPLLVGSTTFNPDKDEVFNSAILFDKRGNVKGRYFKNHLVMFGEYFPIVRSIPILSDFIKVFRSLTDGAGFERFEVGEVSLAPNICFETTVPHLIRRQLNTLEESGKEIDVIVNVTNDGWFFGTSCLDLHFACNTLRAVELHKPLLVSANTGFSAYVDELGRHVQVGPRRKEAKLICNVRIPQPRVSKYRSWGAWVSCAMGWLSVATLLFMIVEAKLASRTQTEQGSGEADVEKESE